MRVHALGVPCAQDEFSAALDGGAEPYILLIVYSLTATMGCLAETRLLYDYDDAETAVLRTAPSYAAKVQIDRIFHR